MMKREETWLTPNFLVTPFPKTANTREGADVGWEVRRKNVPSSGRGACEIVSDCATKQVGWDCRHTRRTCQHVCAIWTYGTEWHHKWARTHSQERIEPKTMLEVFLYLIFRWRTLSKCVWKCGSERKKPGRAGSQSGALWWMLRRDNERPHHYFENWGDSNVQPWLKLLLQSWNFGLMNCRLLLSLVSN